MTEQRLLLLKEKIIKTDAVINLLAEKNLKQNQLQAKLQFLFEKFVEKSKEAETLHRKVCICLADQEPLKKRVAELETQYSDLETKYNKHVNSSELKFQIISRELEGLKKKNGELSKTNEDLKSRLSVRATKRSKKNSMLDDEIDLLKTENELLSTQVDKLTARCDRESREIERLEVLLAETEQVRNPPEPELKEKISKLEATEEELRNEVQALRRGRSKLEDQLAELRLEKNLMGESSVEHEEPQSNQKCNAASSKKSLQIEESSLPFIETNFADVPNTISHLKEKISKLEHTEEQLRCEIVALKKERNHLDDQLADLHLEKNLLKESNTGVEEQLNQDLHARCNNVSDRKLLELIEHDLSNKNIVSVGLHQTESHHQHKEQLCKLEIAEEELLRNDVDRLGERLDENFLEELEVETVGIGLTQMELFGADDSDESSDAESVTDLLREMIDLPATLVPFDDDSCSEIEDCLGFTPTEVRDCRICANESPAMPSKILRKISPGFSQCQATSGDFNVSAFSAGCHRRSSTLAATKRKGNIRNSKLTDYRMHKRKPIIKKKHLKRLKLAITQDMLRCMEKYFRKNLKSLRKFDGECSCKRKSPQFRRNEKLIRQKVEKLREIRTSESEHESSPVKRRKFKFTRGLFSPIAKSDADISNKIVPKTQTSKEVETCKWREDDEKQATRVKPNCEKPKSEFVLLNVSRKRNDVDSEKPELEIVSQDSGYARSEADSLELETQNHEKIFASSASLKNDTSELPPMKRCDRKTIDIVGVQGRRSHSVLERKRKCKEDKTVITELANSEAHKLCPKLIKPNDSVDLHGAAAICERRLKHPDHKISLNCSTFGEIIDSPASPEPDANYDDSFALLSSPVHAERPSIYEQVQINTKGDTNMSSLEVVHTNTRITPGRTLIPEEALKRLKDRIASTVGRAKTAQASFKRPNCAKRLKQVEIAPPEPPAVVKKPVPVKKICKMNHAHAKRLFKRLLSFGNEPSVVDQVASKFIGQNKKHVADLILAEVCLYTSEKVETKYTPPAPPLTQAQRLLLGFMYKLEMTCMSGLLETFLSAAEKALLTEVNLEHLQQITRLYVAVCKFKKDLDRMRRTICDAFYFTGDFAVPFLFTVLSMWIEVLPMQMHSTDDVLVKVLIQVINLKTCKTPGYNLLPLRNLLKVHYEYPTERWNLEEVFREVFNVYLSNPTKSNEYALLVLCKNHPPKWVLQQMEAQIKNVSVNPGNVDLKILTTVTQLVSQFHSKEAVDVTSLKTWLSSCLQNGLSNEVESSVQKCINLLENT